MYKRQPYEIYWTDVGDRRGFTLFDTETLEHLPVDNPFNIFHNIYYEDDNHQTFDARPYENKIVKVIVRKKSDTKKFEKFLDKLYHIGVADLKVVENYDFGGWFQESDCEEIEGEDTLSILNRYIQESEIDLDKSEVTKMMSEIYREACEMV